MELFPAWRYHAVFTDSPVELVQAEAQHRDHAIIEQVFADWTDGPLAHLPSGRFPANAAWSHLRRDRPQPATLPPDPRPAPRLRQGPRRHHPRRPDRRRRPHRARHARRVGNITLHLPEGWHHQTEWLNLFEAACGPPAATA